MSCVFCSTVPVNQRQPSTRGRVTQKTHHPSTYSHTVASVCTDFLSLGLFHYTVHVGSDNFLW